MVLFYCDLSSQNWSASGLPDSLKVERKRDQAELGSQDLHDLTDFWNPKLARRRIKERFELGASLWLIKSEGRLAGFGWTLQGHSIEPYYLLLSPDDVHFFDFHVFPEYRGRGLNPLLVGDILRRLASECAGRAFIEAAEWNQPQLASLRRTPFHYLGSARKFTLLRRTVVSWAPIKFVEHRRKDRLSSTRNPSANT
jgi:ribosomal protein S18 acetylase RimI-like enzyme